MPRNVDGRLSCYVNRSHCRRSRPRDTRRIKERRNERHGRLRWTSCSLVSASVSAWETSGDSPTSATKMEEVSSISNISVTRNVWRFSCLCYKNGGGQFYFKHIHYQKRLEIPLPLLQKMEEVSSTSNISITRNVWRFPYLCYKKWRRSVLLQTYPLPETSGDSPTSATKNGGGQPCVKLSISRILNCAPSVVWCFSKTIYFVITARIRRMVEGTVFSLFVSSHLHGGVPRPGLDGGGGTPVRSGWWGGTPTRSEWWGV